MVVAHDMRGYCVSDKEVFNAEGTEAREFTEATQRASLCPLRVCGGELPRAELSIVRGSKVPEEIVCGGPCGS
jgi:hypothetical protein